MTKEKRTGLLVTLAVLAVWIYIEMEPVLSQNAGAGFFGQQGQGQVQAQDWSGNAPQLVPQNYLDQGIRSQGYGQGMPSRPQNQMPMPRNDSMMGGGGMAANQFQQMPQQQAGMPMFGQAQMQQQMQQQMPQQQAGGIRGLLQKFMGGGQPQAMNNQYMPNQGNNQGFGQFFNQNPNQNQIQNNNDAMIHQAVAEVQQELSIAANNASQAEGYRSEAYSVSDRGAKQSAASEARYYANEARAAASRAMSKARGIPQAMSIASQVQSQASRAQSAADSASSAASGW